MSRAVFALGLVTACAASPGVVEQGLSAQVKRDRLAMIRDAAAEMGVYNAALLGGIAMSETNLAHCWSEATYACKGPSSPSCGGGPIIAGSADGPCASEQGGLGMFQFDAGTYAQTVATYGDGVLTIEGNTAQAVAFVVAAVIRDEPGVGDWRAATAWINQVPLAAGDPVTEEWARLIACRYNGCCSGSTLCTSRANGYRDNALDLYAEQGGEFWRTADRCAAIPDGDVIDQRTECYVAGGAPRAWHHEDAGHGDDRDWAASTDAATGSSFGQWLLRPSRAGGYRLDVFAGGGTAKAASYRVVHAGRTDTVVIDQSAADGFVALGEFELAADGDDYVLLDNATGARDDKLVFDALRVTSLDGDVAHAGGGCDAAGGATGGVALVLLAIVCRRPPRRWTA